jgi:hypothetical protein
VQLDDRFEHRQRCRVGRRVGPAGLHVAVFADTVTIAPERDATLIEDPAGALANGTGPLFVGRTAQFENSRRRAVLRFDLPDAVPRTAIIESVELTVHVQPSNLGGTITLHRVLADWSEGPTFSGGGGGGLSQPGDVSWIHTTYPVDSWVRPGGQFVARTSAAAAANGTGPLSWTARRHIVEDVQLWQHAPSRNFGWILIGDETLPQTATILSSREDPDPERRPRLTIRYRLPGRR